MAVPARLEQRLGTYKAMQLTGYRYLDDSAVCSPLQQPKQANLIVYMRQKYKNDDRTKLQ